MWLKLLFMFYSFLPSNCASIEQVRSSFHTLDSEKEVKAFINLCQKEQCIKSRPYLASAIMQQAEYALLPTSKYAYFSKGKKMLENYIESYPADIEARYVRVLVQANIPKFLGYSDNISRDLKIIRSSIETTDLPLTYKKQMLVNLNKIEVSI